MSWVRLCAILLAIGVHASVLYGILWEPAGEQSLQEGRGNDDFTVVATVTMADGDTLGRDEETTQQQTYSPPQQQVQAQPEAVQKPEEPKPVEPETVQKPEEPKPVEAEAVQKPDEPKPVDPEPAKPEDVPLPAEAEEKPPVKEAETPPPPPPPPETKAQVQAPEIDEQEQRMAANRALEARKAKLASAFLGQVYEALGRHKVRPQTAKKGRVLVSLTIAPSGEIISNEVIESSGTPALDKAAIASLQKAAPYPPIPSELSKGPYTVHVPFEYSTR